MQIGTKVIYTNPYYGFTDECRVVAYLKPDEKVHIKGPMTNVITNIENVTDV